jgi:hypothetical protein
VFCRRRLRLFRRQWYDLDWQLANSVADGVLSAARKSRMLAGNPSSP